MIKYLITLLAVLTCFNLQAQQTKLDYSAKGGLKLINKKDYKNAALVYSNLLKKYPRSGTYNFYMGICKVKTKSDISGAIKMLNYAKLKRVSNNVYFYLGEAHQLSYNFEEAISNYKHFLKITKGNNYKVPLAKKYLHQCEISKPISSKIYSLKILDKKKINKSDILNYYNIGRDVGKLYYNKDFFESGVNPNHIMFETERGDIAYFIMKPNQVDSLSIFKVEKLIDGWGNSKELLSPVNSDYNDAYPFLDTDGLTFYFASDRPGGFGGYDIYKCYYDSESQSFIDVVNMGIPFNSPYDDFFFVTDQFKKCAWFATNRDTRGDSIQVCKIMWDGTQVRNMVENANEINTASKLIVSSDIDNKNTESRVKSKNNTNTNSNNFTFIVNDTLKYHKESEFKSDEALELFRNSMMIKNKKDSLSSLMQLKRKQYSNATNQEEKNKLVNNIIKLENKVYELDDKINSILLRVRKSETSEIVKLIQEGTYFKNKNPENKKSLTIDGITIPDKYVLKVGDEFERHNARYNDLYNKLFSENDKNVLIYADSIYVWADLLNINSSKLRNDITINSSNTRKTKDTNNIDDSFNYKNVKEQELLSIRLYHRALDKKYPIYFLKIKDLCANANNPLKTQISDIASQANSIFREAQSELANTDAMTIKTFEHSAELKKAAVTKQEEVLNLFINPELNNIKSSKTENYDKNIYKSENIKTKKNTVSKQNKYVYKIQIGVFRNKPKAEALKGLPKISTMHLNNGITKYFIGEYSSAQEAAKHLPLAINNGFTKAFVVCFENGKLVKK